MSANARTSGDSSDGRRSAVHIRGLEVFVIEAAEVWEYEPCICVPNIEIALSTSRDLQGPIFHINSVIRTVQVYFSLYRYYSIGMAIMTMKDAFQGPVRQLMGLQPA